MSTMLHDVANNAIIQSGFDPASRSATANGSALDFIRGDGLVTAIAHVGAFSGGSSPTLDLKVQESADGSTGWADVTGSTFTQSTAANIQAKTFQRGERYLRVVATIAGSPTGIVFGVALMEQKKTL